MPVASPPTSRVEPVIEYLHGIAVVDPYRWLEDQNSERTRNWVAEQTAYTRSYLNAIPGRALIRSRVERFLSQGSYRQAEKAGNRTFFLKREAHQEQFVLAMREGDLDEDTILLDPVQMTGLFHAALNIVTVSPNGRLLAFSVRSGGQDSAPIGVLDVDNRRLLKDRLAPGICGGLVFSEERRGFYYVHRARHTSRPSYQAVCWHALGAVPEDDQEIFFLERPNLQLMVAAALEAETFVYRAATMEDPIRSDFYLHAPGSRTSPRKILEDIQATLCPFFVGRELFAFTDLASPNGRIVEIDMEHPAPGNWRTVVPDGKSQIVQFGVAGDSLALVFLEGTTHRLRIFDLNGKIRENFTIHSDGTVQLFPQHGRTDTLFYQYSSFDHKPAFFRYRYRECVRQLDKAQPGSDQITDVNVKRVYFPARDGTSIPMFLVAKKEIEGETPGPVFLTAYGGFGTSITPRFTVYAEILMELGCLFAVANVRGGAEFGKEWHEAARRRNRQTAIDDFLSAADWLVAEQIARPGKIAIGGGSNAGLLVGAALTQRPDLFRAVVCLGPLLDMLRYHRFDLASYWIDEFGSADEEDDFHSLQSYSPYHQVRDRRAYPAVMFISGDADTRCNPMHARKMTARLQAANTSEHPILLDYKPSWGHVPVQPLTARVDALTDRLLFLCHELGLKVSEMRS